jgi:hypothetical protein
MIHHQAGSTSNPAHARHRSLAGSSSTLGVAAPGVHWRQDGAQLRRGRLSYVKGGKAHSGPAQLRLESGFPLASLGMTMVALPVDQQELLGGDF